MIVVDIVSVVVIHLVGAAAVYLWAVACGINLGNRRLRWQGVDSARQWGGVVAR